MKKRNGNVRIHHALKPYRKRLRLESAFKAATAGVCIGAITGLLAVALSYMLPVKIFYWHTIVIFSAVWAVSSVLVYRFVRPGFDRTAVRIDEMGLNEKTQTMLQFAGEEDNAFVNLQREDAIRTLQAMSPKHMKMKLSKKLAALAVAMLVAFSACGFLPNEHREEIIRREEQLKKELEKAEELIKKLEEKIEETPLSPELKEEAQEILETLKETLREEESVVKKLAAINEAMEKFDELAKKAKSQELDKASESLKENRSTENLGEAIESGDSEKVKEELEKLLDELKNTEESELKEKLERLADAISEASQGTTGELNESLSELAEALKEAAGSGDLSKLSGQFENAGQAIENAMSGEGLSSGDINQLLEDMKNVQSGSQGEGQGQGQGNGNGQGEGNGQGNGEGNGQGNGQGGGQGNGAGQGPGNEVKDDVSIYDPSLAGGDGDDVYVPGKRGEDGQIEKIEMGEADMKNGTIPYGEVYSEYAEKARQAMDRESVPDDIRSLIEKYFSSLE